MSRAPHPVEQRLLRREDRLDRFPLAVLGRVAGPPLDLVDRLRADAQRCKLGLCSLRGHADRVFQDAEEFPRHPLVKRQCQNAAAHAASFQFGGHVGERWIAVRRIPRVTCGPPSAMSFAGEPDNDEAVDQHRRRLTAFRAAVSPPDSDPDIRKVRPSEFRMQHPCLGVLPYLFLREVIAVVRDQPMREACLIFEASPSQPTIWSRDEPGTTVTAR